MARKKTRRQAAKLMAHDLTDIRRKRLLTEKYLRMSIEDWRQKKRQQWQAIINAMELFTYGCAYTPVGNDFYEMQKAADRIKAAMEEDWICW